MDAVVVLPGSFVVGQLVKAFRLQSAITGNRKNWTRKYKRFLILGVETADWTSKRKVYHY